MVVATQDAAAVAWAAAVPPWWAVVATQDAAAVAWAAAGASVVGGQKCKES